MRPDHVLLLLALSALPSAARATPPSPANSTVPSCISLVGSHGSVPAHAFGAFGVTIRDLANNPVPGAMVTVDLSGCPELYLCADQLDPDATVNCVQKTVSKHADALGMVHFTLLGGSIGAGQAVTPLNGGKLFWDGQLLGSPTVSAFDLDGSGGVSINDLSVWIGDFGTTQPFGRCDYDCNASVGINDLSLWLRAFGSNTQTESCAPRCP